MAAPFPFLLFFFLPFFPFLLFFFPFLAGFLAAFGLPSSRTLERSDGSAGGALPAPWHSSAASHSTFGRSAGKPPVLRAS